MNFVVLWLFAKVFSVNFSPIRKSFLPQKFPAIQYDIYTHIYSITIPYTLVVKCNLLLKLLHCCPLRCRSLGGELSSWHR